MANQLRMAMVHSIEVLLERGWSRRRIARELGIDRESVGRYARIAAASAEAPTGSGGAATSVGGPEGPSKPARAPPGSVFDPTGACDAAEASKTSHLEAPPAPVIQPSRCEPFRAVILTKLEQGLSAKRIHQDLTAEHGFAHAYHSVRRFVQHLRGTRPLPFRRMECEPGAQAQIDFGTGAPVIVPADPSRPGGKQRRRRTHVLRVVLSHSRKAYSEAVYRQTTEMHQPYCLRRHSIQFVLGRILGRVITSSSARLPQAREHVLSLRSRSTSSVSAQTIHRPRAPGICRA